MRGTLGTAGRPPHHRHALSAIRAFLRRESCFDILPESFRLIVFDNNLLIKRALVALQHNGVVSAPLYDSVNYRFMGMFTMVDVIHLIQYYYLSKTGYESASIEVESVDLSALRGGLASSGLWDLVDAYRPQKSKSQLTFLLRPSSLCIQTTSCILLAQPL